MVQVDVFWSYGIGSAFALAAYRQLRKLQLENEARRWELGWKKGVEPGAALPDGSAADALPAVSDLAGGTELPKLIKELRDKGIKPGFSGLKDLRNARRAIKRLIRAWIEDNSDAFNNEYFVKNLLFLSLVFVPSGSVLLWSNPSWESMHVGSYETIPQWLVGIFTTTNITQGILGFLVTYSLLMKGRYYHAALQTMLAHTAFYFVLINGWDKAGYRRFLSRDRESFENWKWTNVFPWLISDVARILGAYGMVFPQLTIGTMYRWLRRGKKMETDLEAGEESGEKQSEGVNLLLDIQTMVNGLPFLNALVAHLLIRWFGWVAGGSAAAASIYLGVMSKRGIFPALARRIMGVDNLEAPPVQELATREVLPRETAAIGA